MCEKLDILNTRISSIKIGKRIRTDLGDLTSLSKSMDEIGLIQPIIFDKHNLLIAGRRRLAAAKKLGWKTIPSMRLDISDKLSAEIAENVHRKSFSVMEIAKITKAIAKTRVVHRPSKKDKDQYKGKSTRQIVAEITNQSTRNIDKINTIADAAMKNKKYAEYAKKVDKGSMSVSSAHTQVTAETRNLPKVPLPKGEFDVFYVDVPIKFNNENIRGGAKKHYPLRTPNQLINDFKNIPAAKNAVMFFWMSPSIIHDEVEVEYIDHKNRVFVVPIPIYKAILDMADFKVKGEFSWNKKKIGNGHYNRNQHETLLFCIKGKMPTPIKKFSSMIEFMRGEHSEKPNLKVQKMIEEMYPKRKYCQLFGRNIRRNWVTHGNQIQHKN